MTELHSPSPVPRVAEVVASSQQGAFSVPYIFLAALLIGSGIFLIFVWITAFEWLYLSGILLLVVGTLMLFSPRAGADRAR